MSVDSAISRFRQRQSDLFRDRCTVTRLTGSVFDPATGGYVETSATVYTGPCLARSFTWQGSDTQAGEQEIRLRSARIKFPVDTAIDKDDVVAVTASTYDPSLIGPSFRVTDSVRDGWQIVRTAIVEEVT